MKRIQKLTRFIAASLSLSACLAAMIAFDHQVRAAGVTNCPDDPSNCNGRCGLLFLYTCQARQHWVSYPNGVEVMCWSCDCI